MVRSFCGRLYSKEITGIYTDIASLPTKNTFFDFLHCALLLLFIRHKAVLSLQQISELTSNHNANSARHNAHRHSLQSFSLIFL